MEGMNIRLGQRILTKKETKEPFLATERQVL